MVWKLYVFVNNSKSPLVNTKAGVPQGSVFVPLLFLLYVNDIADNLLRLTRLFADDTSLSYSSQNPYTIEDVMNSDLESISIYGRLFPGTYIHRRTNDIDTANWSSINFLNLSNPLLCIFVCIFCSVDSLKERRRIN